MRRLTVLVMTATLLGGGCRSPELAYQKAPPTVAPEVQPNPAGAKASTGGAEATITPQLATELLVRALPDPTDAWTAADAVEIKLPIPLPDGTRTEYTRVDREYRKDGDAEKFARISLTDTRGIPALLLFLDSYEPYENESGYRKALDQTDSLGWISYALGANGEKDGTGSVTQLIRGRFVVQIDGGTGVSAADLEALARSFNVSALK